MQLGLEEDGSFEAGGHTAGFEADRGFEGIRIDTQTVSINSSHFSQNLISSDRTIKDNSGIAAQDKVEPCTRGAILRIFRSATRMIFASLTDADNTMGSDAGLMAVKKDISGCDSAGLDGFDNDDITIAYGRVHAVSGCAELYLVSISQQIGNQLRKHLGFIEPHTISIRVKSAAPEERLT